MLKSVEDQERIFNEQLENCGVEFFDYFLLHNIGVSAYQQACKYDTFGFALNKKKEGKIKNLGISFHDTPELLEEILTAHPELDFVQLQINYIDGVTQVFSQEDAMKWQESIISLFIVMEPCKEWKSCLSS